MLPQYGEHVEFWAIGKEITQDGKEEILYWSSKKGYVTWTEDIAQATHFKTIGSARSKLSYARQQWGGNGRDCGRDFLAHCNGDITVREIE